MDCGEFVRVPHERALVMRFFGRIGKARLEAAASRGVSGAARGGRRLTGWYCGLAVLGLAALAACTNGAGTLLVDPGRYSAYHCNDLAAEAKTLASREKDLRDLIMRANQGGGGGAVIGSVAYRSDYESVRTEERLVQREAAEKNCNFNPQFQSDQVIR